MGTFLARCQLRSSAGFYILARSSNGSRPAATKPESNCDTLQRDDNRRTAWSYFLDKLQADFGDLADSQLDIAINWGRHAELFAYDDDAGELYLEE